MKFIITVIALVVFFVGTASAQLGPVFYSHDIQGKPGPTLTETASDASQSLATDLSSDIMTRNGRDVLAVLITVETNPIRFALGGTTPTDTLGHVMSAGDSIRIVGEDMVRSFRYINDTAGSNAVLMITPEY